MKTFRFIPLLAFLLAGCSGVSSQGSSFNSGNSSNDYQVSSVSSENSNLSYSSSAFDEDYFNKYQSEKYIIAKRIFDNDYFNNPSIKESFGLKEIPDLVFEYAKQTDSFQVQIDQETALAINYSLYIADANQDGHYDICYSFVSGSGIINYGVEIFDIFNKKSLLKLEERNVRDFVFDLDENSVLILEEFNQGKGYESIINDAKRLLKNSNEITFEKMEMDSFFKGFFLGYDPDGYKAKKGTPYRLSIYLHYLTKTAGKCPIKEEDVVITCADVEFTYTMNFSYTSYQAPQHYLEITFSTSGIKDVVVSVKDFAASISISVIE